MLSFECIKNEKSVYFLLTSAFSADRAFSWTAMGLFAGRLTICFFATCFFDSPWTASALPGIRLTNLRLAALILKW